MTFFGESERFGLKTEHFMLFIMNGTMESLYYPPSLFYLFSVKEIIRNLLTFESYSTITLL